jgi:hypothetical protein
MCACASVRSPSKLNCCCPPAMTLNSRYQVVGRDLGADPVEIGAGLQRDVVRLESGCAAVQRRLPQPVAGLFCDARVIPQPAHRRGVGVQRIGQEAIARTHIAIRSLIVARARPLPSEDDSRISLQIGERCLSHPSIGATLPCVLKVAAYHFGVLRQARYELVIEVPNNGRDDAAEYEVPVLKILAHASDEVVRHRLHDLICARAVAVLDRRFLPAGQRVHETDRPAVGSTTGDLCGTEDGGRIGDVGVGA